MKEKVVEDYLVNRVAQMGGSALKLKWLGGVGFPDRVCFFPGGRVGVPELKRPVGGRKGPHQPTWIAFFTRLGFPSAFLKNHDEVDEWLKQFE